MSLITDSINFTAYLADSADHLVGGTSNLAASTELWTGDVGTAGNIDASAAANAATQADQLTDIKASENATLPGPIIPPTGIPSWIWWLAGGVGVVVVLAVLAPYLGFLPKGKS